RFKTTAKGLKNYVMSDETSLDEAMAAARSDDERENTAHQLDAFHATFNFCMTCRQYTCGNCWNEVEGRCLTCAPHLGHEIMPAPFPELPVAAAAPLARVRPPPPRHQSRSRRGGRRTSPPTRTRSPRPMRRRPTRSTRPT